MDWHLHAVEAELRRVEAFLQEIMPQQLSDKELLTRFMAWIGEKVNADGIPEEIHERYEIANPSWMFVAGLKRYWQKFRAGTA